MVTIEVGNTIDDFKIIIDESEERYTVTIDEYKGNSKEVIVPDNIAGLPVTAIGTNAFEGNESVINIILPKGITNIEDWAFWNCVNLVSIKLPESLVRINNSAFEDCISLAKIELGKNIITIEDDAFENCVKLKEITVDEQNQYFTSCDGVLFDKNKTTLILFPPAKAGDYAIPDSVNTIVYSAFQNVKGLTDINFPKDLFIYADFSNCENLGNFTVDKNSKHYSGINGILFCKDKEGKIASLLCYPQGKKNTDYAVPDGITYIKSQAFYNCKQLKSIILPEGLEEICYGTFRGCEGLTELSLPVSLEYIHREAFIECPNLKTITLSRNTKIGYMAFNGFTDKLIYRD